MHQIILVTGASGYIASRLIPRLLNAGYIVRCLSRDPARLKGRAWFSKVKVVTGDVSQPSTLPAAMQDVSVAYYLVHSMSAGKGYDRIDLASARFFSQAARDAGVGNIIYLGGLADPNDPGLSLHMKSRIGTGASLREAGIPVTEFRAGVIIGPGSVSFEIFRFIAEQFPVIIGPKWLKHLAQPISTHNVLDFLMAALVTSEARGKVIEIGTMETIAYIEIMSRYAKIRGLKRVSLLLPFAPVWFMAFIIELLTPIKSSYAYPLVQSLQNDSLVMDRSTLGLFTGIELMDFASSVQKALAETHPAVMERVWLDLNEDVMKFKHEGMFIDYQRIFLDYPIDSVFNIIKQYLKSDFHLLASPLPSFTRNNPGSWLGLDFFSENTIRFKVTQKIPGDAWLEWHVVPQDGATQLEQTLFFLPKGLPGFLSWYLIYPFIRRKIGMLIHQVFLKS